MTIAKVEPLTRARALRGPFDYRLPDAMSGVGVGTVLLVPFGRRRVLGVVVELAERSELPPERLAEPIEALEAGAPPELVRLGLWVAHEYCSTPSRGISLALPPGTAAAGRGVRPRRELRASVSERGRASLGGAERLGARQRAALELLASAGEGEERSAAELGEAGADPATLRRLERRGLVVLRQVEVARRPAVIAVGEPPRPVELAPAQRRAAEALGAVIEGRGGEREQLLHGVTGSGKTEVYLTAAEAALARGRGVIVLVPEIGLTPQALTRFRARFGETVAVLHSRLSPAERRDEWERLRSGRARVCVGPRSAVFAPVSDLGLLVVDEEHDPSYKQEGDPRYDARAVARRRAAEAGAALVLGSATPRPESWRDLPRLELPERVDGRRLPEVELVDMRERSGAAGPLHPRTRAALAEAREQGGKAIVMLNRRGFSPFLACHECGQALGCPSCDVSLVLHRAAARLACHHCGHSEPEPRCCPACGSLGLARHGIGTERLEALLASELEPLPVFRLDSDAAAGRHAEILRRFGEAPGGALVGTQMVAKGHDFPDVTLSVLLDADATLRFPDFRAEERAFSQIAQLAGRSGRGEAGGRVIVQTLAPEAEAIRRAAAHDVAGFLAGELERRRELRYPPFASLVRVEVAAPEAEGAERAAAALRARIEPELPGGAELLGPAPRLRTRGRHRRQLLLKAPEPADSVAVIGERAAVGIREQVVAAVRDAVEAAATRELRGCAVSVDVDPQ